MKKAKGVKKNIIKNQITHNDYKICLENKIIKTVKQKMIRSTKHKIYTIEQNKRGLSSFDDKDVYLMDKLIHYLGGIIR